MPSPPASRQEDTIKSGWLFRRTNVLKKWKRSWFVMFSTGRFLFYEDPSSPKAVDLINVPVERPTFLDGADQCGAVETLPDGHDASLLFGVKAGEKVWILCAESSDEVFTWKVALDEALAIPSISDTQPPPGQGYYFPPGSGHPYAVPNSTNYVYGGSAEGGAPPSQIIYIHRRPYYYGGFGPAGLGLAGGAMMGAMWLPWLWFPMMWC